MAHICCSQTEPFRVVCYMSGLLYLLNPKSYYLEKSTHMTLFKYKGAVNNSEIGCHE